ncbi:hypothetical protein LVJ83_09325 [Uruburuella testudinis]|uniref:ParG protein n=1 Tax=Uruburuella testudinis TaxID=1282863 RepID=A0ABY4DQE7_9NEIS|nr:hypothetical protein [Uruburuella testudinis]UOO81173.1 hypothetical protein LVJ83_09325 [Uruburuella testudinis]
MANANTEHSRKLRAATAAKVQKEKLASGEYAQITLRTDTKTMADFKAILDDIGGKRPEALKKLIEIYWAQK